MAMDIEYVHQHDIEVFLMAKTRLNKPDFQETFIRRLHELKQMIEGQMLDESEEVTVPVGRAFDQIAGFLIGQIGTGAITLENFQFIKEAKTQHDYDPDPAKRFPAYDNLNSNMIKHIIIQAEKMGMATVEWAHNGSAEGRCFFHDGCCRFPVSIQYSKPLSDLTQLAEELNGFFGYEGSKPQFASFGPDGSKKRLYDLLAVMPLEKIEKSKQYTNVVHFKADTCRDLSTITVAYAFSYGSEKHPSNPEEFKEMIIKPAHFGYSIQAAIKLLLSYALTGEVRTFAPKDQMAINGFITHFGKPGDREDYGGVEARVGGHLVLNNMIILLSLLERAKKSYDDEHRCVDVKPSSTSTHAALERLWGVLY